MKNIFDFHFHLLFKHLISKKDSGRLPLTSDFKTKGIMSVIDEFMGNAFDSQSSRRWSKIVLWDMVLLHLWRWNMLLQKI